MRYSFEQVLNAYRAQDPNLVAMLVALSQQPDPTPTAPIPEEELTFERFLSKIFSPEFRKKHPEVQFAERVAMIARLEASEGVYPLPDRFKIHIILRSLWEDNSAFARAVLVQAIEALPLSYGVWKGFKAIFKQAESRRDFAILSPLMVRIDTERFNQSARTPVSVATKTYMSLRAWRLLRNIGEQSGFLYPSVAVQVLAQYPDSMQINSDSRLHSWVLNHILFHNHHTYGVSRFAHQQKRQLFDAKGRAFAETWQRDPQPLLDLMMTARNEGIRQFATDSLKQDFKTHLREVSVATIQQLSASNSGVASNAKDELIVWLISQSPSFEQSQFVALGLHDVVLKLLFSQHSPSANYAFAYAKSYALDVPLSTLLLLADSQNADARQFAIGQILSRDPRQTVGLVGWGQLLDSPYHYQVASEQLIKHFNRRDFSPEWFAKRLLSRSRFSVDFAVKQLFNFFSADDLGQAFFIEILASIDTDSVQQASVQLALDGLKRLGIANVPVVVWQWLLLHPFAQSTLKNWLDSETLHANTLPMTYWHALAYTPDWQTSEFVKQLKTQGLPLNDTQTANHNQPLVWQKQLNFNPMLAEKVRTWLADVRRFVPVTLGFDWLMGLANSGDSQVRQFAIDRINKGFLPADFVSQLTPNDTAKTATATPVASSDSDSSVDLAQQSFLFTGKMQSMTRETAEAMVKNANGKISSAVNNKLDFLVIGDDGSPLYGNGRKGSKQLKAEQLIANGASLKIISETAFLQRLSGQVREVDTNATVDGANVLWQMAISDPNSPMSELATTYLSHHHQALCMALTDRPVDPEAVIPNEFFSPERVIGLLYYGNTRLREFALSLMRYEFANWHMTASDWVKIAESPHNDVQKFVEKAVLDPATADNRYYHITADKLSADMLYALLDSQKRFARKLGVTLLMRYPQFHQVQTLYRLTESTDREVRYAAVKMLWQHYHDRHLPNNWQPKPLATDTTQHTDTKPDILSHQDTNLPAEVAELLVLLKRGLFELPVARLPKNSEAKAGSAGQNALPKPDVHHYGRKTVVDDVKTAKPIASSRAKVALIETFRDVALTDADFAEYMLPTLQVFTESAGKMERHACLVAVVQILAKYPQLISTKPMPIIQANIA